MSASRAIHSVLVVWAACAGMGCGDPAQEECFDPVGRWDVVLDWRQGDCGFSGQSPTFFDIVQADATTYAVAEGDPTYAGSGFTEINESGDCFLRLELSFEESGMSFTMSLNLTVLEEQVGGYGTVRDAGATCEQTFLILEGSIG